MGFWLTHFVYLPSASACRTPEGCFLCSSWQGRCRAQTLLPSRHALSWCFLSFCTPVCQPWPAFTPESCVLWPSPYRHRLLQALCYLAGEWAPSAVTLLVARQLALSHVNSGGVFFTFLATVDQLWLRQFSTFLPHAVAATIPSTRRSRPNFEGLGWSPKLLLPWVLLSPRGIL